MNNTETVSTNIRHKRAWQLALLAFAQFIIAVEYNIVYVALPDIGSALHFSTASLQWVVSAYAIGFGGFLLLGGRAADKLGHRRIFILGLALFGIATLAGGFAVNQTMLVVARLVQGIGAALLSPATLSLINTTFKEGTERNKALATWGAAGSGGLAVGAVLGGVFTSWLGWQWVLFVMAPMAALAIWGAKKLLSPSPAKESDGHSFDIIGAALATSSSIALVFALVQGPETGWLSPLTLIPLLISAFVTLILIRHESSHSRPLIPLDLFRNKNLLTSIMVILVFQAALGGAYYLLTLFLQEILNYGALQAGLAFLPITLISIFGSLKVAPYLLGKYGLKPTLFLGMLVNGLGLLVLTWGMSIDGNFWLLLPGLLIWGLGGGTTFPTMFIAAASGVKPSEQGVASALASTSQQIGGAVGLAILVAIAMNGIHSFSNTPDTTLLGGLHTAGIIAGIISIIGAFLVWTVKIRTQE